MSQNSSRQLIIERPLRLCVDLSATKLAEFKQELDKNTSITASKKELIYKAVLTAKERIIEALPQEITNDIFRIFTVFNNIINTQVAQADAEISPQEKDFIKKILTFKDPSASQVIKRANFKGEEAPIYGVFTRHIHGKDMLVEYEEDQDLQQKLEIPQDADPEDYFTTNILPKTTDAWIQK